MHKNKTHYHFLLHKPYGFLSQFINNQKRRKNKHLLGELFKFPEGIMAIGRLDETSEGLLFLTTDGRVSEHIRSQNIEKEYYVQVDGIITNDEITKLKKGVEIGIEGQKYLTKPCKAQLVNTIDHLPLANRKERDERHGPKSWVSITITEGKFRQVRKMTAAVGYPTLRLVRVRIGDAFLNLKSGEVIEVEKLN